MTLDDGNGNVLIWLPSPIGDAVLSTSALRSLAGVFKDKRKFFLASKPVRDLLSPTDFCDEWICPNTKKPFETAMLLKKFDFSHAILFKNSFSSALAVWLAGIGQRVGYSRQGRGLFLNSKLYPPKENGKFKPNSMVDYYMGLASLLGGDTENRQLELKCDKQLIDSVESKLPLDRSRPIVILVPGGAFGPSKCWSSENFAALADMIIEKYDAQVLINVAPKKEELEIADQITELSKNDLVNLGSYSFSLAQIKAVFSKAHLVVTNDTGPRHIAIALQKKVVTLFGPNDPAWTETGWEKELQIVGQADCAPCARKECFQSEHICMESITPQNVFEAVGRLWDA